MRDGLFVLVVCGPHGYFVPFGAHVNDSAAHVIAVVIKGFAHQTQKLQGEQLPGKRQQSLIREQRIWICALPAVLLRLKMFCN